MLTQKQVQFFRDNGYLKVPAALAPDEVAALRGESQALIDAGPTEAMPPNLARDYQYGRVRGSEEKVLRRIEYVQSKGGACLRLLRTFRFPLLCCIYCICRTPTICSRAKDPEKTRLAGDGTASRTITAEYPLRC